MWKRGFYFLLLLSVIAGILFFVPLFYIYENHPDRLDENSPKTYGVVFGASIRPGGKLSQVLKHRVDDAIELYKNKKIQKIVFSGSSYGQISPGEPRAMRNYALRQGVKTKDIILDERGDRTYLTVEFSHRLSRLHPGSSFVFISSGYHLLRIRFLVFMMQIPNAFFYFTPRDIAFYNKDVLREIAAFWFYAGYKLIYKWR